MGTRGLVGFVVNGENKLTYNHFDSYPDGLGLDVLHFLQERLPAGFEDLVEQADALVVVQEDEKPTPEQVKELLGFANTSVSDGDPNNWYVLLREAQGDLAAILASGYLIDGQEFGVESLFCEWAYTVDLDKRTLFVYEGFKKKVPTEGIWAGRPTPEDIEENWQGHLAYAASQKREPWLERTYFADPEYKGCHIIASFPFSDGLPDDETFLKVVNAASRYSEDED